MMDGRVNTSPYAKYGLQFYMHKQFKRKNNVYEIERFALFIHWIHIILLKSDQ